MKRIACIGALLSAAAIGAGIAAADSPRLNRIEYARLENKLDAFLLKGDDPCQLLGNTRGLYLDGYGTIFTTMVALVPTPIPNPFRDFTQKDVNDVYNRKIRQVPIMREKMKDMLLMMAADPALEGVRANEQVVYGANFFYYKQWEIMTGLPAQIVMQGEKQKLLDIQSGRVPRSQLGNFLKIQEL